MKNTPLNFEKKCTNFIGRVKKSLYLNWLFLKEIGDFDFVYSIIDKGYSLHFESYPPSMQFGNNKSVLLNAAFVSEAVR